MIKLNQNSSLDVKYDWTREEILEILNLPLIDLMWNAQIVPVSYTHLTLPTSCCV